MDLGRAAVLPVLCAAAGPALAAPEDAVAFEILRKGEPIGFHLVSLESNANSVRVTTEVEMKVRLGPFPVYGYRHEAIEVWRDGMLETLQSRTVDNGLEMALSLRREGGRYLVDGTAYRGEAPPGAEPSSYWNRAVVDATTLINSQNGEIIPVEASYEGVTPSPDGTPGDHYRIVGTVALDVWYQGDRWIGSDVLIDGEELTYRLAESPMAARLIERLEARRRRDVLAER
jgi:hypothetical protein